MRSSILKYRVKKERNKQSKSQNYPLQVEIDNLIKYLVCSFIWVNFFCTKPLQSIIFLCLIIGIYNYPVFGLILLCRLLFWWELIRPVKRESRKTNNFLNGIRLRRSIFKTKNWKVRFVIILEIILWSIVRYSCYFSSRLTANLCFDFISRLG